MLLRVIELKADGIKLPESMVVSRLGFKGAKRVPDDFMDVYQKALNMVVESSKPTAIVRTVPCRWNSVLKLLEKKLTGKLVEKHLKNCEKVTLMLITLGRDVDLLIEDAHLQGNELLSFFLDAVASEFAECVAREVDLMLKEEEKGYVSGARISPGYVDLPLQLNQWIVNVLDGNRFGIKVKEDSYMLLPRKTISALIGWRKKT